MRKTTVMVLCAVVCGLGAPAFAQTGAPAQPGSATAPTTWTEKKGFVDIGGGFQAGSHTLETNATPTIYGEAATIDTTQKIGGGGLFEISGGYKVWRNIAIAVGYTHTSNSADGTLNASIPDPLLTDSPRAVNAPVSDLKHSENAVHLSGVWMNTITDKIEVGVSFGPTIFSISQDVPGDVSIAEPGPTITGVTVNRVKKTTVGVNFGVDTTYMLTDLVGVHGLARYTWGSTDIDGATDSLGLGGFQMSFGARVRF